MVFKSKMKWVGLLGLVLSAISLFVHFLLARFTEGGVSEYHSSITIFPRRTIGESLNFSKTVIALSQLRSHFSLSFIFYFLFYICSVCSVLKCSLSISLSRSHRDSCFS